MDKNTCAYETIYEEYYNKYYRIAESLVKQYFITSKSKKRPFLYSINEARIYLFKRFIDTYQLNRNHFEELHTIYNRRYSFYSEDENKEIFLNEVKAAYDKINFSELPQDYSYTKFLRELAIVEVAKEIDRLLSNNSKLFEMIYISNEFDLFEIKYYRHTLLESLPLYKLLHKKAYPEYYLEEVELEKVNSSLIPSSNDNASKLFEYLIEFYRPKEVTSVKFINIHYYLKNDAMKEFYIFKITQKDYRELVSYRFGINISKFSKSDGYYTEEKPILNSRERLFRKENELI